MRVQMRIWQAVGHIQTRRIRRRLCRRRSQRTWPFRVIPQARQINCKLNWAIRRALRRATSLSSSRARAKALTSPSRPPPVSPPPHPMPNRTTTVVNRRQKGPASNPLCQTPQTRHNNSSSKFLCPPRRFWHRPRRIRCSSCLRRPRALSRTRQSTTMRRPRSGRRARRSDAPPTMPGSVCGSATSTRRSRSLVKCAAFIWGPTNLKLSWAFCSKRSM